MQITIDAGERERGALSEQNLRDAMQAVRRDGFVLLGDVVSRGHAHQLSELMEDRARRLVAGANWGGAGKVPGHIEQDPPTSGPFWFEDIVANPFVSQVVRQLLGSPTQTGYTCNTSCPGSSEQPVHRDGGSFLLFAKFWLTRLTLLHPPRRLVVNFPLVDFTEENGATEFWPGSHLEPRVGKWVPEPRLRERRKVVPPVRVVATRGAAILRDFDLWHRGMPNRTDHSRHMLALTFSGERVGK